MKVIISPDSFKGTLTTKEAASAIEDGIKAVNSSVETVLLPIADGGEGTVDILVQATGGTRLSIPVLDPLGRSIHATYGVLGDGETVVIEMAAASGIILLQEQELNPKVASSYGTGQLIIDALNRGFRKFILGLGGSATNEAGIGMLYALGLRLLNNKGVEIEPTIEKLSEVSKLDFSNWDERLHDCTFLIASDVNNPLLGDTGATAIFGSQKGVKKDEIPYFEKALLNWANIVERELGMRIHDAIGAGAAGGMGSAFLAFLNGQFQQGITVVLQAMNYEKLLKGADLIITGEGQSDKQTLQGKAPFGILTVAKRANIPTVLISGNISVSNRRLLKGYFEEVISVVDEQTTLELAMSDAKNQLKKCVERNSEKGILKKWLE